jgi:hypothetical protein
VGEQRYEIENHLRTLQEVNGAGSHAGLSLKSSRPVYFGPPEFPVFHRAGKEELFGKVSSIPALFINLWEKPC